MKWTKWFYTNFLETGGTKHQKSFRVSKVIGGIKLSCWQKAGASGG